MSERTTALYYAIVFLALGAMSAGGAGAALASWSAHAVGLGVTTVLCWLMAGVWLVEYEIRQAEHEVRQAVRAGALVQPREMPSLPSAKVVRR